MKFYEMFQQTANGIGGYLHKVEKLPIIPGTNFCDLSDARVQIAHGGITVWIKGRFYCVPWVKNPGERTQTRFFVKTTAWQWFTKNWGRKLSGFDGNQLWEYVKSETKLNKFIAAENAKTAAATAETAATAKTGTED